MTRISICFCLVVALGSTEAVRGQVPNIAPSQPADSPLQALTKTIMEEHGDDPPAEVLSWAKLSLMDESAAAPGAKREAIVLYNAALAELQKAEMGAGPRGRESPAEQRSAAAAWLLAVKKLYPTPDARAKFLSEHLGYLKSWESHHRTRVKAGVAPMRLWSSSLFDRLSAEILLHEAQVASHGGSEKLPRKSPVTKSDAGLAFTPLRDSPAIFATPFVEMEAGEDRFEHLLRRRFNVAVLQMRQTQAMYETGLVGFQGFQMPVSHVVEAGVALYPRQDERVKFRQQQVEFAQAYEAYAQAQHKAGVFSQRELEAAAASLAEAKELLANAQ